MSKKDSFVWGETISLSDFSGDDTGGTHLLRSNVALNGF